MGKHNTMPIQIIELLRVARKEGASPKACAKMVMMRGRSRAHMHLVYVWALEHFEDTDEAVEFLRGTNWTGLGFTASHGASAVLHRSPEGIKAVLGLMTLQRRRDFLVWVDALEEGADEEVDVRDLERTTKRSVVVEMCS